MSFSEFGLSPCLLRSIQAAGYSTATPIQAAAIPHVLAGRDVLGCAQTGTGKTAAFALPILNRFSNETAQRAARGPVRVLVLSPTRELALQISESFRQYGRHSKAAVAVIYGGVNQDKQVQSLRRGVEIVVATPGRLRDLIEQRLVRLDQVDVLVLDEADRMLDMGFLPDVQFIIKQLPTKRQTVLFSATMPPAIEQLAKTIMHDPTRVYVANATKTVDRVQHTVCLVPRDKKVKLLSKLLQQPEVGRTIVFSKTKHGADRIVRQLEKSGVTSAALHGNKTQNARQRILASFRSAQTRVLVATDIAARGIDVDGISHVINFDLPTEPETYLHRIGRTARAGAEGIAISFCGPDEQHLLRDIERFLKAKIPVDQLGLGPVEFAATSSSAGANAHGSVPAPHSQFGNPAPRRRNLSGKYRPRRPDKRQGRRQPAASRN
jgi:ATP-dependent RNA helicase RhlE